MEAKLERSGGDEGREERDDSSLCSLLFWFAVIEYSNEFNRVLRPCREQLSHDRFCLPGDDEEMSVVAQRGVGYNDDLGWGNVKGRSKNHIIIILILAAGQVQGPLRSSYS